MFALLFVALTALCCAPHSRAVAPAPPQIAAVVQDAGPPQLREFARTVHGSVHFTPGGRELIAQAGAKWGELSEGRIKFSIVFDLDDDSIPRFEAAGATLLDGLHDDHPIVRHVLSKANAVAVTFEGDVGDPTYVFLFVDRLEDANFLSVVTHELGHVVGFEDQPTSRSVMSGRDAPGERWATEFTAEDRALCQALRFCR